MRGQKLSKIHFLILLSLLGFISPLQSQEYKFRTLGVEDGLSQITVSDICQDEKSRIWIATLDGLNCFDGNHIKVFNHFHNDSISYGNLYVTQMVEDGQGSLFLLTSTGLFQFDLETEKYYILPVSSPSTLAKGKLGVWIAEGGKLFLYDKNTRSVKPMYAEVHLPDTGPTMVEGSEGNLWVALKDGGVMRVDTCGSMSLYLPGIKVMKLIKSNDQNIWIGSQDHGVFCFSPQGAVIHHYDYNNKSVYTVRDDMARALCQDLEGNIWVGYRSGLSKIEVATGKIFHYQADPNRVGAMSNRSVTSLYTDKQGTVWVGTYWGGVNFFSPEYQHFVHYHASDTGLSFPVVGAMAEDKSGNIWICTEGGGLDLYQPEQGTFKHFNAHTGYHFSTDYLKDVVFDEANNCLWIAADFTNKVNCFHLDNYRNDIYDLEPLGEESVGEALFALADTPCKLYVGTTSAVVSLDKQTLKTEVLFHQKELFTHNYNTLLLDSKNRLWFASDDGCVAYVIDEGRFETYRISLKKQVRSQKELVNVIYEDRKGNIWVGTHGNGLFLLDKKERLFRLHTPGSVLSGENIRVLGETPSGNLLIGTGHGLSVLEQKDGKVINFNSKTGFPLTLVNRKSMHVSRNHDIYMGGATGLVAIRESSLSYPPKIYDLELAHLYVNNKEITTGDQTGILNKSFAYTDRIKLNYLQNVFSIGFSTDNFLHIGGGEVEYRLIGSNDEWSENRLGNDITYTNISPGDYVFEIRLKNFPEVIRSLHITITPPFYATWWAYTIYVCVILTILFFVVREYRIRLFLKTSLDFELREKQYIEEMNQSKLRFFTNISHEIRTPITLILGQVDLLLNSGKLSTYAYSKLLNIHKNAGNLKSLITELLDFRKQEQGLLKLKVSQFDLYSLLKEHYVLFKELAANRNISFVLHADCEQCLVWGDRMQLQKVVNNLLSNAFKYTSDGGSISMELADGADECMFSVSDNGAGISEEDYVKIFERFYQAENIGQYGGTGIGLALSQGIVKAHQGDITVESQLGKGSCFKVTLKKGDAHFDSSVSRIEPEQDKEYIYYSEDKELLVKEVQTAQSESGTTDCKLLVIDDNEEIRNILVDIFSPLYTVETASDGEEGYEKVKMMQPDLVISDIMMPGMPGTELCAKIKNNIETCHIPVVLLTALSAPERELEGLRIGADIYVVKPFNMRRLVMQCNNLINTRRLLQNKYAHQLDSKAEKIATNELDQRFIEQATQVVEDNMENPEFSVDVFSREMGVGRTVLFQKIKGITGSTPNNFIMNLRLKKAAYFLQNSPEMNISDIAYRLGFGNPQYFNKCFKELFDIAPTQYRKAHNTSSEPSVK
ncbi:response regulator [Bacteroides xylanisolvens]|jgi:signal transduction histidine kinase/ligand-binding sensor domain-containing protein/DNA-binding response OmpR family regulator|uniref:histidine kinase n=1 Tax=Bacteroides xylanisolvens TaxID=371601 RepID=A0A415KL65_9BACE|nr:two-component regulator propeller domain-containing protein [Bacteroides xylanisolvens]RHF29119.1 response regulator [Bacteroides xylanisolvens]RHL37019.1 response regulator [Bacteroides xylanisolvens]